MSNGYIKVSRDILDNPWVNKDPDHLAVMINLLKEAAYAEMQTIFCGKTITLKPGQLVTGRKKLASETRIDENKIKRILDAFENEHLIEQQKTNHGTLISLLFYDSDSESEQQSEQQLNSNRTATEQQLNTKRRNKKDKKEITKEDVSNDTSQKDEAVSLWNDLPEPVPKVRLLTPKSKREKKLKTLLTERGMDNYRAAVENIKQSPFLLGKSGSWNITFDWFVELGNFDKVLEGNYLDRQQARAAPEPEFDQAAYDHLNKVLDEMEASGNASW